MYLFLFDREEARRAYATFIRAGAAKELNLEDKVRERVKNQLEISTREFETPLFVVRLNYS